jgi:hypothetical protein
LSIYLRPECRTFAEFVLVPFAAALYFCGVNPKSDPTAIFNGQCMLVQRNAYEFVGGHGAVISSVIEDIKLAALAKRHRLKFAIVRAPGLGHGRMQAGMSGIWSGFERNAFRFMLVSPWIGITIILAALSMALWLPVLLWLLLDREWVAAAIFGLLPTILLWNWYAGLRALLAPLAIYPMLPVLWNCLFAALSGRELEWKGRVM